MTESPLISQADTLEYLAVTLRPFGYAQRISRKVSRGDIMSTLAKEAM